MNKNDFYYVLSTKLDTQIVVFWWELVGKTFYEEKNKEKMRLLYHSLKNSFIFAHIKMRLLVNANNIESI